MGIAGSSRIASSSSGITRSIDPVNNSRLRGACAARAHHSVSGIRSAFPRRASPARMSSLHFLDTNILLYSISRHPAEDAKRDQAIALLEQDDGALSVQVLQEFYVQATRPARPDPLPHEIAAGLIATWMRFSMQEITILILTGALEIKATARFLLLGQSDHCSRPRPRIPQTVFRGHDPRLGSRGGHDHQPLPLTGKAGRTNLE